MSGIAYGLPAAIADPANAAYPGMALFAPFLKLYGLWVLPVDRAGVMRTPVRTLSEFAIPAFRSYTRDYEELCNERASQVLRDCERLGTTMYVLYSGGIDSTCLLVSLLKNASPEQKKRIVVLLSHESIAENPRFYDEHIRGRLRVDSSITFPERIGGNDILLSAEHNDLVMGNASIGSIITQYGPAAVHKPYARELLVDFFTRTLGDGGAAEFYFEFFDRLCKSAPVEIRTNFDFMWWFNFATKWQACFCYILFYTLPENASRINKDYLDSRFISFYNTEEFQLWSMNNLDKRIKDTWKSYKWVMKDIIYDYTKDADYRDNKTKVRSLPIVMKQHPIHFSFLDENFGFKNALKPQEFLDPENDYF